MDAKSTGSVVVSLPTDEFRSLPIPFSSGPDKDKQPKMGTCFVHLRDLPEELRDWMGVNPRTPVIKKDHLAGRVPRAMIKTLDEEPDTFVLRNQGIWLIVDKTSFKKAEGGAGELRLSLSDADRHGIVNGGHTYFTALQSRQEHDGEEDWNAYVRLHILENVDPTFVVDMAEGLNTSMQVDDSSLANLAGVFDDIKAVMEGQPGEDAIAYRQGDPGVVDVREVITMLSMFDLNEYDRKRHPNVLFGQKKSNLNDFVANASKPGSGFKRLIPHLPTILRLSDRIQQVAFEKCAQRIGRLKVSNAKSGNRAASPKNKHLPAHFAGGTIGGKFHLGWLYPMLAAFRANVNAEKWKKGSFQWLMDPEKIIDAVIEEMVDTVIQEHQDNKGKPAEVGRREAAYRLCYSTVTMELAEHGKMNAA